MTQVPPDSKGWPSAGADDKPVASGEQIRSGGQPAEPQQTGAGPGPEKDDPHRAPESGDKPEAGGQGA